MNKVDFLKFDFSNRNILIIGKPSAGKTFVSNILSKKFTNHSLIHTDDFLKYPKETQAKEILISLFTYKRHIIEGNICYQLLLEKNYLPDVIINITISNSTLHDNYRHHDTDSNALLYYSKLDDIKYLKFMQQNKNPVEIINIDNNNREF